MAETSLKPAQLHPWIRVFLDSPAAATRPLTRRFGNFQYLCLMASGAPLTHPREFRQTHSGRLSDRRLYSKAEKRPLSHPFVPGGAKCPEFIIKSTKMSENSTLIQPTIHILLVGLKSRADSGTVTGSLTGGVSLESLAGLILPLMCVAENTDIDCEVSFQSPLHFRP